MLKFHVSTSAAALAAMATLFAHPPVAWAVTPAAASEAVGAPASPARQLMMLRFALQEYSEGWPVVRPSTFMNLPPPRL